MRTIIPTLLVAAAILAGCHSPSVNHTQPTASAKAPSQFHPMFITTLGTHATPDGSWRVSASEASLELSRSMSDKGEGWTTSGWSTDGWHSDDKPAWWTAHEGWFVFVESASRAWAYSGDGQLKLVQYSVLSG